jgi:hypothetical protein
LDRSEPGELRELVTFDDAFWPRLRRGQILHIEADVTRRLR